jgi:hypothetical protein
MNTKSKQDQKKNRRPQAGQTQQAQAQGAKRGRDSRMLHEQELPELRMTR